MNRTTTRRPALPSFAPRGKPAMESCREPSHLGFACASSLPGRSSRTSWSAVTLRVSMHGSAPQQVPRAARNDSSRPGTSEDKACSDRITAILLSTGTRAERGFPPSAWICNLRKHDLVEGSAGGVGATRTRDASRPDHAGTPFDRACSASRHRSACRGHPRHSWPDGGERRPSRARRLRQGRPRRRRRPRLVGGARLCRRGLGDDPVAGRGQPCLYSKQATPRGG